MALPDSIRDRIELFSRNEEQYRDPSYKEAQLRQEFLDPLFAALGWDMDNRAGHAESYKDVVHEDAIKIGSESKAPDYSFRIGGTRKFFVEAKKPSVLIKDDPAPAYQLRRYSWSAKLPLGILTDFQEFAIYDTRIRPAQGDKAHTARLFYCTYRQLPEKWDEIAGIFAKDSVLRGSFDKYAATTRGKRGTATVDVAFLEEIERWREVFARALALRNEALSQRDLNFAVQRLIDRLIFLRIAEDRGLEPFGQLQALTAGNNLYPRLREIFERADYRYNSGLFHFEKDTDCTESPDRLSLRLDLDDAPLKDVLKNLYYPASPYVFSVIPADILGSVYERFLGKVIHLTDGHRARIEEKPEVRKAGGVYYTPTYIVDYIVRQTVGTLVADKTPKQIEKLRVLDPACGSGSFLIGAYQFLLDWYLDYYARNDPEKWAKQKPPRLYETAPNAARDAFGQIRNPPGSIRTPQSEIRIQRNWQLTTAERKRILLAHIHGVDIDSQAVEVTKLSLLLKVLEGEARETQGRTREMSAVLPDLGKNIRCGNSLVGHDFYAQPDLPALDDDARLQLNTFDWAEGFPEIMRAGGFDAVIGNPPYLNVDDVWGQKNPQLLALKRSYPEVYNDKTDLLFYFLAKAHVLSKDRVAFIVSRAFLEAFKADKLRAFLATKSSVNRIIDFRNFYVFPGVGITTAIIEFRKASPSEGPLEVFQMRDSDEPPSPLDGALTKPARFEHLTLRDPKLSSAPWVFSNDRTASLCAKVDQAGTPIGKFMLIGQGMQTGANNVFGELPISVIQDWHLSSENYAFRISNSDIGRYSISRRNEVLLYVEEETDFAHLPAKVRDHLNAHISKLKGRAAYKRGNCEWWKFTWPLHKTHYSSARLVCPYLAQTNRFALVDGERLIGLTDTTVLFDNEQAESLKYLLGLLNSRLLTFRFRSIGKLKGNGIYEYFWNSISRLCVKRLDLSKKPDRERHDRLVELVDTMLALHAKLAAAQSPDVEENLRRQIAATDRAIDALVYALYGLTAEEIALVESATAPQTAAMDSETEQPNQA